MSRSGATELIVALAIALTAATGCYRWSPSLLSGASTEPRALRGQVRFFLYDGSQVEMAVKRVEPPLVHGVSSQGQRAVDLREVLRAEVRTLDGVQTAAAVVALLAAAGVIVGVAVAVSSARSESRTSRPSSSQKSCPHVFVDAGRGLELVGEAYAGASAASLQREDLLPLPAPEPGARSLTLRLANLLEEVDWTDQAGVLLVDHPRSLRAVTRGLSGPPLLVGPASPPRRAWDLEGREVTAAVARSDGKLWQSDLFEHRRRSQAPGEEGLVAAFAAPRAGARAVLEIRSATTPWLDYLVGRLATLAGPRLDRRVSSSSAKRLREWRARAGVDLTVELERGGRWLTLAVIPATGPVALRHFALPLPPLEPGAAELRVRLRGGLGFLRVDQLALSEELAPVRPLRLAARRARSSDGLDRRDALAAIDGRYSVQQSGEHLELELALPPLAEGRARSLFLATSGYYLWHPPAGGEDRGRARALLRRPEELPGFGLELLRELR